MDDAMDQDDVPPPTNAQTDGTGADADDDEMAKYKLDEYDKESHSIGAFQPDVC